MASTLNLMIVLLAFVLVLCLSGLRGKPSAELDEDNEVEERFNWKRWKNERCDQEKCRASCQPNLLRKDGKAGTVVSGSAHSKCRKHCENCSPYCRKCDCDKCTCVYMMDDNHLYSKSINCSPQKAAADSVLDENEGILGK